MAESVILYFAELGCIRTQRAPSDYRGDRGLHSESARCIFEFEAIEMSTEWRKINFVRTYVQV